MQQLKPGSFLQGGKYKIEKVLGQGGFGITYLATQELLDRKVCIKEFFYKEYCERDEATSHVSLGTQSNHEIVERFMNKFLKEARTISQLDHRNIIKIHDIFKENNTAYYVMDYVKGESLNEMVSRRGALPEKEAVAYIERVADALKYIHQQNINHLDIKPSNIMIRQGDYRVILIDFGLSKQYDAQGGQTSTTPVGISHGYAPMEQYKQGGVSTFSPQTDIYALGATLYKLVTGNTPPQAMDILDEGLPSLPSSLSSSVAEKIKKAMQPRKVDRPKSIDEFLSGLNVSTQNTKTVQDEVKVQPKQSEDEATMTLNQLENKERKQLSQSVDDRSKPTNSVESVENKEEKKKKDKVGCSLILILGCFILFFMTRNCDGGSTNNPNDIQSQVTSSVTKVQDKPANIHNNHSFVDLGLSVKWASCNVFANTNMNVGEFFPWTLIYDQNSNVVTKNWGKEWRLPTREEFQELMDQCEWSYDSKKKGFWIEGKNGNKIFLPAGGHKYNDNLSSGGACYWTSTLYKQYSNGAFVLSVYEDYNYKWEAYKANFKFLVRPVLDNNYSK